VYLVIKKRYSHPIMKYTSSNSSGHLQSHVSPKSQHQKLEKSGFEASPCEEKEEQAVYKSPHSINWKSKTSPWKKVSHG
jgi:hypothetical protein